MDAREIIQAALYSPHGKFIRGEIIVFLLAVLLFLKLAMDILYRLRSNSSSLRSAMLILETVTDPLVLYTIGFIQGLSYYPSTGIWGTLLYIYQLGMEYITTYSITDTSRRKHILWRDLVFLVIIVIFNNLLSRAVSSSWFLWVVSISFGVSIILYKFLPYQHARNSYYRCLNSKLLVEYMKNEYLQNEQVEPDPTNMKGYRYVVWGEDELKIDAKAPDYRVSMEVKNKRKFITLEAVWNCPGHLLKSLDREMILKDVCLSYALHKLQCCEMSQWSLPSECHKKTQKLFFKGVILDKENDKRVFRIVEMQIAFLSYDYNCTRFPICDWGMYPLLKFFALILTVVMTMMLSPGSMGIILNTILLLFLISLKELWEIALYIFSDWTKVVIICRYVEGSPFLRNRQVEPIILRLCKLNFVMRSYQKMSQYNFLESFNCKARVNKSLHLGKVKKSTNIGKVGKSINFFEELKKLSIVEALRLIIVHGGDCKVKKSTNIGKVGKSIKIFEEVKESIVQALRLINVDGGDLTKGICRLYTRRVRDNYQWACTEQTCYSHLILLWHIATSMCEIHELSEKELGLDKPGLISHFHNHKVSRPHRYPFLVDLKRLEGRKRAHYIVANSISRYCAYLLVSVPELLADHVDVSKSVFDGTVSDAQCLLSGCDSLESILWKLMYRGFSLEQGIEGRTTIDKGAMLGTALLMDEEMNMEARWEMLANFWVDLLLFLAPSNRMEDHRSHLQGGEFITLLWALFANCGVFDRTAEEDQVPENNGSGSFANIIDFEELGTEFEALHDKVDAAQAENKKNFLVKMPPGVLHQAKSIINVAVDEEDQVPENNGSGSFGNIIDFEELGTEFKELHNKINAAQAENKKNFLVEMSPGVLHQDDSIINVAVDDIRDIFKYDELDISIVRVFTMYLEERAKKKNIPVGFMDPARIDAVTLSTDKASSCTYMADVMLNNQDKKFIMAPYFQDNHWILIVFQPCESAVYVLDSMMPKKGTKTYDVITNFKDAFEDYKRRKGQHNAKLIEAKWNFRKCPQQPKGEVKRCGYYVLRLMLELMTTYLNIFPTKCSLHSGPLSDESLHKVRRLWCKFFIKKCLPICNST